MKHFVRLFWGVVRSLFCAISNLGKVRLHGLKYHIGKGTKIYISKKGLIDFGKKLWIDRNSTIEASNGKIQFGYNNFFNTNCKIVSLEKINIGDNNLFGPNVVIVDHNHRYCDANELICHQGFDVKEINIGSNIWVGANTTICAGVNICDNVVIGANSVVNKDINMSGVYAGAPVKFIKNL